MPELPEVETVRLALKEQIIGKKILNIESNYPYMVLDDFETFKQNLIGKEFVDINRKGKYLIFNLDDINLISHLRMEGKFFYVKKDTLINKHIHIIFSLDNDYELRYQDTRKFGRMLTKSNEDLYNTLPLSKLAKDANSDDFDKLELYKELQKRKCTIKEALLNQEIIAGLGNIYVDEVLALSKISPKRKANKIKLKECDLILDSSKKVLNEAIKFKGTTIRSYTSSLNVIGNYQNKLIIHTKTHCPYCNGEIIKEFVGQRGTYWCIKCQK